MIPRSARLLLRCCLLPLVAAGAGAQSGPAGGGRAPLKAEVHEVRSAPFAQTLPTVGTLRANEAVTPVSQP